MSGVQLTLAEWRNPTISSQPNQQIYNTNNNTNLNPNIIPIDTDQPLHQTTITQWSNPILQVNETFDSWGHLLQQKPDNIVRIVLRNISSLPKDRLQNKNDILINEIMASDADVYCATEVNLAWQNVRVEHNVHERFKGKLEFAKYVVANNRDTTFKGTYQPGGTMIITQGKICGRIVDSGKEDHTLQRWTWIKLRGKNTEQVIIANLYRPVKSNGPISTYQQHKSVLLDANIDTCPRENILQSLSVQIQQWQKDNFKIIITGDFNDDVNGTSIKTFFRQLQLIEVIIQQHGQSAPNTMIKGSKPIDGIFCSDSIHPIRSGYMPFAWGMATDHRLLWIDVDMHQLLGTIAPPLWKPKARRLQCNNPIIVNSFNKLRVRYLLKHQSNDIQNKLQSTIHDFRTTEWKQLFEKFDAIRTDSIQHADRHCRRLKMGHIPWSPDVQQAMLNITYLQRCRLKYINGYQINTRTLYKAFSKTTYEVHFHQPDKIVDQLKQEFKQYNELKRKAAELRYSFLNHLAEAQAQEASKSKAKIYQQLLMHESVRNTFRKIKFSIKDNRNGVTMVESKHSEGIWCSITEKHEIEQECINENIRRLTQASTTPPMLQDQIQLFGWKANTDLSNDILQGNIINTAGIHPDLLDALPFLQIPNTVKQLLPIRENITTEEYKRMWNRSREQTSCGVSGLHFGHFIASCKDEWLSDIDRWFMEKSLQTGHSLERWHNGIDVMIPKKVDSLRVDKLRTIVLMEPDFNFINKIIGKRVMALAEQAGSVAPEQFGSRKRKSAIIHAVNKQLTTDILRQDKKNFCLIVLDAKACYDRITPMYASFAMKRQGASDHMINLMFDTITQMTHYIQTSYGDSDVCYKQGSNKFHGILQGNGAGPTMWAMISSTILDQMRKQGLGVQIETQDNTTISIPAFTFVDDTDLLQQIQTEDFTAPQTAVSAWSKGLRTLGGLIVAEKCLFQIFRHKWHNNKWTMAEDEDNRIQITIPNEEGIPIPIRESPPKKGEIALGIAFSPIGNMEDEINYLRQKTTKWAEKIARSNLTHIEAWTALKTTVFKTIEYSLPTTLFTRKNLQYITAPAINTGLSKSGICCKTSRTLIYAPNTYQGFGLKDPYITQGVCKLQLLFNPYNQLTMQLIEESWNRAVIECGIGPQMMQHNFNTYKHILTYGWITNLWEFLSETGVSLQREQTQSPFRMQQDTYLNEQVFKHQWTATEKTHFNNCRLYFQVELLSDIITANGQKIRTNILKGKNDPSNQHTLGLKAPTPTLSTSAWKDWEKMIRHTFQVDTRGNLSSPVSSIANTVNWHWFLQPSSNRIIRKQNDQWHIYTLQAHFGGTRRQSYRFHSVIQPDSLYLTPISVYQTGQYIRIDGIGSNQATTQTSRLEWCDTMQHSVVGDINKISQYCQYEELIILSDATVQDEGSYAAWIIATTNSYGEGSYIKGFGKIFEENSDSHRAECFGILGGIATFQYYKQQFNMKPFKPLVIVCDNQSAINYAGNCERYQFITSNIPDFDVLTSIRKLLESEHFTYQHVKGHQDNSIKPLTILTTINIHVDLLAAEAGDQWDQLQPKPKEYHFLNHEKWQLKIQNKKIYKQIDVSIRNWLAEQQIPPIWHKYKRVEQTWFHEVNWEAMNRAMKASNTSTKHWILKRCARDCGAHAILLRRKERNDDHCPMCGLSETVEHVYKCQHIGVISLWDNTCKEFALYLESIHTDPVIIEQLITGMTKWRNNTEGSNSPMIVDQSQIGWNGVLEGILGRHWTEEQDYFLRENDLKMKGQQWASLVVRKLWKIAWDIWDQRNNEAHKNDQSDALLRLKQQAMNEQTKGDQGHREIQRMLDPQEVERVLQGNITYISCWIRSIQAKRNRLLRIQEHSPAYNQMHNTLRQFLTHQ